jgi:alpha-tubulin suppressor-like RCC1 family protein
MKLRYLWLLVVFSGLTLFIPPAVCAAATNKSLIAAGFNHTLAIQKDGSLWAWGYNDSGQLGLGDYTPPPTHRVPTRVGTASDWVAVAAGAEHSLGLKADGTLWAWGQNGWGKLGLGPSADWQYAPAQVSGSDWIAIAAGFNHNLGLKADGTLWAWGTNVQGELGLGFTDSNDHPVPVQVEGFDGIYWVAVAAGHSHSIGLTSDGNLWAWGRNGEGQLGLEDTINRNAPSSISPLPPLMQPGWTTVTTVGNHCLGLKSDGTLWAWGDNASGQLGLGDTVGRTAPTHVALGGNGYVAIAAGTAHSLGLKADGWLLSWGNNLYGQLGLDNTTQRLYPTIVGNLGLVTLAANKHCLGLKADGTLWAWGLNNGILGLGDTTNRLSPTQVPSFNARRAAVIPLF